MKRLFTIAAALALVGLPSGAEAHMPGAVGGGFVSGVLHVLTGLDHVAIALALGLAAGWSAAFRSSALPNAVFAAALTVGFYAGVAGWPFGIIAAALVIMGALAVIGLTRGHAREAAIGLLAWAALQQGHVHGLELAPGAEPWLFLGGILVATVLTSGFGAVISGSAYWWAGCEVRLRQPR